MIFLIINKNEFNLYHLISLLIFSWGFVYMVMVGGYLLGLGYKFIDKIVRYNFSILSKISKM